MCNTCITNPRPQFLVLGTMSLIHTRIIQCCRIIILIYDVLLIYFFVSFLTFHVWILLLEWHHFYSHVLAKVKDMSGHIPCLCPCLKIFRSLDFQLSQISYHTLLMTGYCFQKSFWTSVSISLFFSKSSIDCLSVIFHRNIAICWFFWNLQNWLLEFNPARYTMLAYDISNWWHTMVYYHYHMLPQ